MSVQHRDLLTASFVSLKNAQVLTHDVWCRPPIRGWSLLELSDIIVPLREAQDS